MPRANPPKTRKNMTRRKQGSNAFVKILLRFFKFIFRFKVAASIITILLILLFFVTGYYDKSKQYITDKYRKLSLDSGLILRDIILDGHKNASKQDILDIATSSYIRGEKSVIKGDPILNIDLEKIQKKLTSMEWIESATIERLLPSTLHIRVVERVPVALWQNKGRVRLIDANGEIINVRSLEKFVDLIIIIGDEAQSHAGMIFKVINTQTDLAKRVSSLNFVSKRRWDVEMFNGMKIKLPEKNADKAWAYLAKMQAESAILDSGVSVLDLRVEDKLYIK